MNEVAPLDSTRAQTIADTEREAIREEPGVSFALTDYGNAERLVARHGRSLRHCAPRRRWLAWDGRRWRWDDDGTVVRLAKLTVRGIYAEAQRCDDDHERRALAKHARASETAGRLKAMIELAQSEAGIPVQPAELDADHMLFNVLNGTIELRTGTLRPHAREDLITRIAPVTYDPAAHHDLWDRFIVEATGGDAELEAYLRRFAGYALTGSVAEKKFFFAHGPKDTSKSTFVDALSCTWGDFHVTADFDTWCAQTNTGGNRGDLVRLAGARLVTSVEVAKGKRFDETLMKRVTGGDQITAAAKYEAEITFRPAFKILLAANDAPKVRDDDDPMWSRVALLPFVRKVESPDPTVKARIGNPDELGPAILAWSVRGCLEWQATGLGQARAVDVASAAYRAEMDPLGDFFAEHCAFEAGARVTRKAMRHAYDEYTRDNGVKHPLGDRDFTARLKDRGCTETRVREGEVPIRGWAGVALKTALERGLP